MELTATNDNGVEKTFENVVGLERDDGDLMIRMLLGEHATEWERVIDGRVELLH